MKKEDFKNPYEWVMYRVNGSTSTTNRLENNMFPKREYKVKYYSNKNGRYTAMYKDNYLCMCKYDDIPKIQQYFDNTYNGKNISKISNILKKKYNQKIRKNKRGVKPRPYYRNRLNFQSKKGGRVCARVSDNGKTHHICQCYENEKKEVSDMYDALKKDKDIDTIKKIMKERYNIIGKDRYKPNLNKHQINILQDGSIYINDEFIMNDSNIYELINKFIGGK